jgi:ParB/RepB/Spo0J family partition protein
MATVRDLPISSVFPNPDQPRKKFAQAELEELASSIKAKGLIQPITVVPREDRWMIVAGERRWRASCIAGMPTIIAVIREDLSDVDIDELAMIENIIREDMNAMEEACGYHRMVERGKAPAEIASVCGFENDSRVVERLSLLKLQPHIQDAIREGFITATQGRQLAYLEPANQERLFAQLKSGKIQTASKLRRAVVAAYDAERQEDLFNDGVSLTPRERKALSQVDAFVDGVERLLATMTNEDLEIIRITSKSDAPRCIEKIKLLTAYSARIRRALETAVAKGEHREAA